MHLVPRIILDGAAALILLGGLYDIFTPRLPPNLAAVCGAGAPASRLVRELLRALGGCLVAIGIAMAVLVNAAPPDQHRQALVLVLLLVIPAEGINSFCMCRSGSPFYFPLVFIALTLIGVLLGWR